MTISLPASLLAEVSSLDQSATLAPVFSLSHDDWVTPLRYIGYDDDLDEGGGVIFYARKFLGISFPTGGMGGDPALVLDDTDREISSAIKGHARRKKFSAMFGLVMMLPSENRFYTRDNWRCNYNVKLGQVSFTLTPENFGGAAFPYFTMTPDGFPAIHNS